MSQMIIKQYGPRVLLILNGKLVADMPWQAALNVSNSIRSKAKMAEEIAKAEQIAGDQAILTRAGFPVGLSNHPKIKDEAAKLAAWDTNLRRYMPGGVKSKEVFGVPNIIQHPPHRRQA